MDTKKETRKGITFLGFLSSALCQNIVTILTLSATIIFGIVTYSVSKGNSTIQSGHTIFSLNGWLIVAILTLAICTLFSIIAYIKNRKRLHNYEIVRILIELQNKYLFNSKYTTAGEHAHLSKERNLTIEGKACILTNSLSYDYNFCSEIANNIDEGAVYIYYLPTTDKVFRELNTFIVELHQKLTERYQGKGKNATQVATKVEGILEEKVKFAFFDKEVLCLYNFARFTQGGAPGFSQSWWYINPTEEKPNDSSQMLTHEINDQNDHDKLKMVFDLLQGKKQPVNGKEIHKNHASLDTVYGRRK